MKKFLFFVFFVLTTITDVFSNTKAVYKDTYLDEWGMGSNAVEIMAMYPGTLLGLRYERKIEDNLSLSALFFYNVAGDISSIGGRLEGNFYVHNHSLNSFFVGPFLSLYNLNGSDKNGLFFGSGINLGYRWIFNNFYSLTPRITFQYGIGPESDENVRAGASGFSYGAGVSGGVTF
jgi:hypothetical protein